MNERKIAEGFGVRNTSFGRICIMDPESDRRFRQCLDALEPRLRAAALRRTGNEADALDLVQETIVRAWQRRAQCTGYVPAWVFTIMRNCWNDALRKKKPAVLPLEHLPDRPDEAPAPDQDPAPCAAVLLSRLVRMLHADEQHKLVELVHAGIAAAHDKKALAKTLSLEPRSVDARMARLRTWCRKHGITNLYCLSEWPAA